MEKTKIICSIGPVSEKYDVTKELVLAGMDCARINLSHASYDGAMKIVDTVRKVRRSTGEYVAIMYDTKGPEFRTLDFIDDGITLTAGETIFLTSNEVIGDKTRFSVNHPEAIKKINIGDHILIDNALLDLVVTDKKDDGIMLRALNNGSIKRHKTINVPGVDLDLPFISDIDRADIDFAAKHSCDYLALSFVTSANDVIEARKIIKEAGGDAKIISKIESQTGIDNIDEIIKESDGIMIARGDLGVEVDMAMLPILQKDIIRRCRETGKFAIVATEMLASMYTNPRPTRAEVSDIANAVIDGTDCVMLSGETTVGSYPIDSVNYMARICKYVESTIDYSKHIEYKGEINTSDTVAKMMADAVDYDDIKIIVVTTKNGNIARKISNLRPNCPILACCPTSHIAEKVALNYGVKSVVIKLFNNTDDMVIYAKEVAKKEFDLKKGDKIIIAGESLYTESKEANYVRIIEI